MDHKVQRYVKGKKNGFTYFYLCQCSCGNFCVVARNSLINNKTKSCGCLQKEVTSETHTADIIGKKYNRLTVIQLAYKRNKRNYWLCQCDCGNTIIVETTRLTMGITRSCGCFNYTGDSSNIGTVLKPVYGYENYYCDMEGNIYSYRKGTPMKYYKDKKGYAKIDLKINNKKYKGLSVHRLIAKTFIPNPFNLPQINHKDENKLNNCVDNLEWCNNKYNANYGTRNERMSKSLKGHIVPKDTIMKLRNSSRNKKIVQYDLNNNIIATFISISSATRAGFSNKHIIDCCKGRKEIYKGFRWRYADELFSNN